MRQLLATNRWLHLALLPLMLAVAGCEPTPKPAKRSPSGLAAQQQASQSAALLRSAIGRLRTLPEVIDPQLQPPSVVLDSRSSLNGRDLVGAMGATPGPNSNPLNLNVLTIRSQNAGFRREIQAGDIVKCYLLPDRESRDRISETREEQGALTNFEAVELKVAQVTGDNTLLVEEGLRIPTGIAKQLGESLSEQTIKEMEKRGVPDPRNFVSNVIKQLDDAGQITSDGVALPEPVLGLLPGISWPFKVEIWRVRDERMRGIETSMNKYAVRGEPPFGWEPSGDREELDQILQSIKQWTRGRTKPADWAPAALLSTVDEKLRDASKLAEYASPDAIGRTTFASHEARLIQEAIWLRDISRWASGDRFDPVERGAKLFDWVVRNVTLTDDPRVTTNRPWQTLLAGRGGAVQRAWVFAGLCRQQKIPAAVIEIPQADGPAWLWCGVLGDGGLTLFDPQLGLPIPAKDLKSRATLAAIKGDPSLLRKLDLPDSPYPVTADQLADLRVNVVAEPLALSWRAAEFETQLRGDDALVLSVDADAQAVELAKLGAGEPGLWSAPFEFYLRRLNFGPNNRNAQRLEFLPYSWRPVLWQARILHFRGLFETEEQARKKAKRKGDALYEAVNDHRRAAQRYLDRSVRPKDALLNQVANDKRRIYQRAKIDATYWLGLLQFESEKFTSSRRWLEHKSLAEPAAAHRADGVRYNLARVLEALGEEQQAAELLEADDSPQRHGNRLRARRLRGEPTTNTPATSEPTEAEGDEA